MGAGYLCNIANGREQLEELMSPLELQKKVAELQQALELEVKLKSLTDKISDRLEESHILKTAVRELGLLLEADCCRAGLYGFDRTSATLKYEYTRSGLSPEKLSASLMADFSELYSQFSGSQCCHFCPCDVKNYYKHSAILACPICDEQGVLGVLWLVHQKDRVFNDLEIKLVEQVARSCARAIRQARLYQASAAKVEELENLNHLKDEFLNTVCHELRTPVANINMAIQMLWLTLFETEEFGENEAFWREENSDNDRAAKPVLPGKARRYLRILQEECNREIHLLNDLLDLQRLDAGSEPLELTQIRLQNWLPHVVEPFEERTRKHRQTLQVDIPGDIPPLICDAFNLERIITELLNNACKYTPKGEKITAIARYSSGKIKLSVSNSGVEIPDRDLQRIFEKFYRLPCLDRRKEGGTGLGLSLVKRLTEYLGGTIQVESAANLTCFTVEFPLNK